jgi:hypothetical protein
MATQGARWGRSGQNAVDVFSSGTAYPCVGIDADVTTAGPIAVGQPVTLV